MTRLPTIALLLVLALPGTSHAWSALGHRLVGELAERHLEPAARREVTALLEGEAEPTLAGVSTWADELRGSELGRKTARWHYVNFPTGTCDYVPERDCPNGDCVIGAIERQRALLADRSQPRETRRDALKFLVHFVGDVHQPMHAGNRNDKGGNDHQISLRTPIEPEGYARARYRDGVMGTNQHSIWDYYVLRSLGLEQPAYAKRLDALPWPPQDTPSSPPEAWALESCRLIDARGLYPETHVMQHDYLERMRPLAEQRVRQAAWRLAALLNATLRP